jgi:histidinol-phosphate phosphatase family protein
MNSMHFNTEGWSLFLDRDGVINKRLVGDYVKKTEEFVFLDGVLDAIATLSTKFNRIFIVTNQQGIGKGLMTEKDLKQVHDFMEKEIIENAGKIDKIYYCPYLKEENHVNRKPNPGMGMQARADFLDVILNKSVIVGDSASDMLFGRNLGMITALVGDKKEVIEENLYDLRFENLKAFTAFIK